MFKKSGYLPVALATLILLALFAISVGAQSSPTGPENNDYTLSEVAELPGLAFNSWTFQGYLQKNKKNANGDYDIKTDIYDHPNAGNLIYSENNDDTEVIDGVFTVVIDNGIETFFQGFSYYLAISVRESGADSYIKLPRQAIKPVPLAFHARHANKLVNPGDFKLQVSPFDAIESDGASTLSFAAKVNGKIEIKRSAQGTSYVYIPIDAPAQIFGSGQKLYLKSMYFCYSGFQDGMANIAGIRKATVWQVNDMTSNSMIGDLYDPVLTAEDECFTVSADNPVLVEGSMWVRFEIQATNLVPLELGEIQLTFEVGEP